MRLLAWWVKWRLRAAADGSDDVLHAGAPDPPNSSGDADVGDGIAVDQYEVGPSAGFDHASVAQPEVLGRQYGRRAQRLDGRQAGVGEQVELVVQAFAVAGREGCAGDGIGVGTREDRHTGPVQFDDAAASRFIARPSRRRRLWAAKPP